MYQNMKSFTKALSKDIPTLSEGTCKGMWSAYCGSGKPEQITMKCNDKVVSYQEGEVFEEVVGENCQEEVEIVGADLPFDYIVARKYASKYNNAMKRGIEFTLTLSNIRTLMNKKTCHYTGIKLTKNLGEPPLFSDITLDRVNPELGYTKGNTVACCHAANQLKSTLERSDECGLELKHKLKLMKKMLEVV